jgi:hypothetical protein
MQIWHGQEIIIFIYYILFSFLITNMLILFGFDLWLSACRVERQSCDKTIFFSILTISTRIKVKLFFKIFFLVFRLFDVADYEYAGFS